MDRTGTLMIKPNQCSIDPDEINVNYPHYNYGPVQKDSYTRYTNKIFSRKENLCLNFTNRFFRFSEIF